ncbi:uncharacterized protein, partial [Drosophila tropicalis]|uniref:uncharacterized protein n=1 Tax=Drosophila tropicalis TaxID=46794 RepID=UPI0035AB915A
RSVLSIELNLLEDLSSVETYTLVSTKYKSSPHYRKLFDITFDGCRVIADVAQSALVTKIYKAVIQSSNQPRKCPIKKGLIYYRNISIEDVLPSFMPVSNLLVQVTFSNLKEYYLNVTIKGKILQN